MPRKPKPGRGCPECGSPSRHRPGCRYSATKCPHCCLKGGQHKTGCVKLLARLRSGTMTRTVNGQTWYATPCAVCGVPVWLPFKPERAKCCERHDQGKPDEPTTREERVYRSTVDVRMTEV